MRKTIGCLIGLCILASGTLFAGEVAPPTVAKLLKIISGSGSVNSLDPEVSAELKRLGVNLAADSRIVWAISEKDVSRFSKSGCLVVCGQLNQIAHGAAIAIVAEGGRPAIYYSPARLSASKVNVPDAVVKIGKAVK